MTTEQILFTGIAACASAIVFMFRLEQLYHAETKATLKNTIDRLSVCEVNRMNLTVRTAVLEKVQELRLIETAKRASEDLKATATKAASELEQTARLAATALEVSGGAGCEVISSLHQPKRYKPVAIRAKDDHVGIKIASRRINTVTVARRLVPSAICANFVFDYEFVGRRCPVAMAFMAEPSIFSTPIWIMSLVSNETFTARRGAYSSLHAPMIAEGCNSAN